MFRNILKLPAGHYADLKGGELSITQYWDLKFPSANHVYPRSEQDLAAEIRERFQQSVKDQMVSDVPIAAFLIHLKLHGAFRPTTKYILRRAMEDVLPREVLQQPKAGFAAPVDYWLAHDLKDMVDDVLCESQIRTRGFSGQRRFALWSTSNAAELRTGPCRSGNF